jgi:hypothetical protein
MAAGTMSENRLIMVSTHFLPLLVLAAFLMSAAGCNRMERKPDVSNLCGGSAGSGQLDGLTWLAGSPAQANVLCQVKRSAGRILQALDPESRDPLLFQDSQSSFQLLVERFSGRQSRPSRLTWFSAGGERLGQRGDWPQNVYGISAISSETAVVAGFDFGVIQRVDWKAETFALPLENVFSLAQGSDVRPVHVLSAESWLAVIDNGYDLIRYTAKDAMVYPVRQDNGFDEGDAVFVRDPRTNSSCRNAFQTYPLTRSRVLLSCNPQYFGPEVGQAVALFEVNLQSDGTISSRELVRFDGAEIQRIDIFGADISSGFVFLGYKKTSADDYDGKIVSSGWLNLNNGEWISEDRFAGPFIQLGPNKGSVVACRTATPKCGAGQFLHLGGAQPWSPDVTLTVSALNPEVPFLSFAHEIKSR